MLNIGGDIILINPLAAVDRLWIEVSLQERHFLQQSKSYFLHTAAEFAPPPV